MASLRFKRQEIEIHRIADEALKQSQNRICLDDKVFAVIVAQHFQVFAVHICL